MGSEEGQTAKPERTPVEMRAIETLRAALGTQAFEPPLLPAVAQRALSASRSPDLSLQDLAKIVEVDQALAARFLSVANSVAYRGVLPTTTITGALARLGIANACDVLFFASVEEHLFKSKDYAQEMQVLRAHSLGTSAACTYLAQFKYISVDDASLAGLVHDLGAAAVLQYIAKHPKDFSALRGARDSIPHVLFDTHILAGAKLAAGWNLPPPVCDVITDHHQVTESSPVLLKLVAAADELATVCLFATGFEDLETHALGVFLEDMDLLNLVIDRFAMRLADMSSEGNLDGT